MVKKVELDGGYIYTPLLPVSELGHLMPMTCGHRGKPSRHEERMLESLIRDSGFLDEPNQTSEVLHRSGDDTDLLVPEVQQMLMLPAEHSVDSDQSPVKPHLEDSLSSARGRGRQTFEMLHHNEHGGENLDFEDIKLDFEDAKHIQSRVSAAQTRLVIPKPLNHPLHTDTSDIRHPTLEGDEANVDSPVHINENIQASSNRSRTLE